MKSVQEWLSVAGSSEDEEKTKKLLKEQLVTSSGDEVVISHIISLKGGQGNVYRASCRGKSYALKWYKHPEDCINSKRYKTISGLVKAGNPKPGLFIWPLIIVTTKTAAAGESFGYLMDEYQSDVYKELNLYLLPSDKKGSVSFTSYRPMLTAGIEMAHAMEILHTKGLSYKDLNANNFAINPGNGHVLVIDNDNVSADSSDIADADEVKGFPGYMAPEIPRSGYTWGPTIATDRYSLAVCLFRLFFVNHPMDGRKWELFPQAGDLEEAEMYYYHPVFSMNPNDKSNEPNEEYGADIPGRWKNFSQAIRNLFIKSFTDGIENQMARVTEGIWIKTLSDARSMLIKKPNGAEQFINFERKEKIPQGTLKMTVNRGEMKGASVSAILPGSGIYKYTITGVSDDCDKPMIGFGVENGWMLAKNLDSSGQGWRIAIPNNQPGQAPYTLKDMPAGSAEIVYPGVQIEFNREKKIVGIFTDARE